jgi:hypothetical protein
MTDDRKALPRFGIRFRGETVPARACLLYDGEIGEEMTEEHLAAALAAMDPERRARVLGPYLPEGAAVAHRLLELAERVTERDVEALAAERAKVAAYEKFFADHGKALDAAATAGSTRVSTRHYGPTVRALNSLSAILAELPPPPAPTPSPVGDSWCRACQLFTAEDFCPKCHRFSTLVSGDSVRAERERAGAQTQTDPPALLPVVERGASRTIRSAAELFRGLKPDPPAPSRIPGMASEVAGLDGTAVKDQAPSGNTKECPPRMCAGHAVPRGCCGACVRNVQRHWPRA